jgi:hypothetical protein
MRIPSVAVAALFFLGLAPVLPAQSLGDAAAQERAKRKPKSSSKPVPSTKSKGTLSMPNENPAPEVAPADEGADAAAPAEAAPAEPAPAEVAAPVEGENPEVAAAEPGVETAVPAGRATEAAVPALAPAKNEKSEEEIRAEGMAAWRKKLDAAHEQVRIRQENIKKIQTDLNDLTGGIYGNRRLEVLKLMENEKAALAKAQASIEQLEDEGRRNAWRY